MPEKSSLSLRKLLDQMSKGVGYRGQRAGCGGAGGRELGVRVQGAESWVWRYREQRAGCGGAGSRELGVGGQGAEGLGQSLSGGKACCPLVFGVFLSQLEQAQVESKRPFQVATKCRWMAWGAMGGIRQKLGV